MDYAEQKTVFVTTTKALYDFHNSIAGEWRVVCSCFGRTAQGEGIFFTIEKLPPTQADK